MSEKVQENESLDEGIQRSPHPPVVAVDAMGGDKAPKEIVSGALQAALEGDLRILLVGRSDEIRPLVEDADLAANAEIIDCSQVIKMEEPAFDAIRRKRDSSVLRCAQVVREGLADGMVTAGNTGAAVLAALIRMGRIPRVIHPALAVLLPTKPNRTVLLDAGAAIQCEPKWLTQFAVLGREYARVRFSNQSPTIGLLSNGTESTKGDQLRQDAYHALKSMTGFIGNIEGHEILSGRADVIVTDGFTGNVALKTFEGTVGTVINTLRRQAEVKPKDAEALSLIARSIYESFLTEAGALLLGVEGICMVCHGRASSSTISAAVSAVHRLASQDLMGQFRRALSPNSISN